MTLREQLHARCRGYCEKCGWPLGSNWAMHHRVLQSKVDAIQNVLALHHECHNIGKDAVHLNVADAIRDGYIVRQPEGTASTDVVIAAGDTPVLLRGHTWVRLNALGTYDYITEEIAHAAP